MLSVAPIQPDGSLARVTAGCYARIVAMIGRLVRHVECLVLVVIFSLFPIAWPAALVVSCMMPRKEPVTAYARTMTGRKEVY